MREKYLRKKGKTMKEKAGKRGDKGEKTIILLVPN